MRPPRPDSTAWSTASRVADKADHRFVLLGVLACLMAAPEVRAQTDPDNLIVRARMAQGTPGNGPNWTEISIHPPPSQITSRNVYSWQFIDAPAFEQLPIPGTVEYRAVVRQAGQSWTVRPKPPRLDLTKAWSELKAMKFSLAIEWVAQAGQATCTESRDGLKAPGFAGFKEALTNWVAAADRYIDLLIHDTDKAPVIYREPGLPVWIWNPVQSDSTSCPCTTINAPTWAFLGHIGNGGTHSADAMRLAQVGVDWVLEHCHPDSGVLPLFPCSTVTKDKLWRSRRRRSRQPAARLLAGDQFRGPLPGHSAQAIARLCPPHR